jgi:hypothetical protein
MTDEQQDPPSNVLIVEFTFEALAIIDELVRCGIYGVTRKEVVERFVDEALQRFVEPPKFAAQVERKVKP